MSRGVSTKAVDTAQASVLWFLSLLLPWAAQWSDKRRLGEEQRQRAWNQASWGCALIAFGPLSMLGWFWVTRRGWRRFVWGPIATWLVITVLALAGAVTKIISQGLALQNPPVKPLIVEALLAGLLIGLIAVLIPPVVWVVQQISAALAKAFGQPADSEVDAETFS